MPNQTHFNYNPPKVQKLIKEGQNRIKTPFFCHFWPKNGFKKKKSNLNGIQVVLGHLFWELLACISTIKQSPLLSLSHHSLEHGYAAKILSLLPLFSIILSQALRGSLYQALPQLGHNQVKSLEELLSHGVGFPFSNLRYNIFICEFIFQYTCILAKGIQL